jgi:hypothetical protein
MVQNYRLSDCVVGASSFLSGTSSMRAVETGQMAVANLQTILEYFDSSDIENIKVRNEMYRLKISWYLFLYEHFNPIVLWRT